MKETVSDMIRLLKIEEFKYWIENKEGLKVIRFCADWSGPCHIMAPIFKELSLTYGKLASFCEVDVEESPSLQQELGVTEIPTLLFYRNGELIDFVTGLISREELAEKLENGISGS